MNVKKSRNTCLCQLFVHIQNNPLRKKTQITTPEKAYFKSYVNLNTVKPKLEAILSSSKFVTCRQYIETCFSERTMVSPFTEVEDL